MAHSGPGKGKLMTRRIRDVDGNLKAAAYDVQPTDGISPFSSYAFW
ncbi:MAG: hypothetical protein RIB43_00640 [Rhodospirillaceae bacterium]